MKPTVPTRPVPRNQSETQEQTPVTNLEQTPNPDQASEKVASQKPEKIAPARAKPEKPQKPQLVAPPARPAAEEAEVADEQVSQADKPILKRDQRLRPVEGDREQVKPKVAKLPTDQSPPPPGAPQRTSRPTPFTHQTRAEGQ